MNKKMNKNKNKKMEKKSHLVACEDPVAMRVLPPKILFQRPQID